MRILPDGESVSVDGTQLLGATSPTAPATATASTWSVSPGGLADAKVEL